MRCYSHLSDDEREQIGLAKAVGHSIGAIAKAIGRGGDRDNPLMVREGVTSKQITEELRQKILETGLLPSNMVDVTPNKVEGVPPQARSAGPARRPSPSS
jgi:Helix-turn-helix domain